LATDVYVENAYRCTTPSVPLTSQSYAFKAATKTATGTRVDFTQNPTKGPVGPLVVDVVVLGTGYNATATWHRTDQASVLDWTVTAHVTVTPQS
jgi:hypothetical protein